jgi:hypothetical protein
MFVFDHISQTIVKVTPSKCCKAELFYFDYINISNDVAKISSSKLSTCFTTRFYPGGNPIENNEIKTVKLF